MAEKPKYPRKLVPSTLLRTVLGTVEKAERYELARTSIEDLLREHRYQPYIDDLRHQAKVALEDRESRDKRKYKK